MSENDTYMVAGVVENRISGGVRMDRRNAFHVGMTFEKLTSDGNALLKYPAKIIDSEWKGLSGAPVFNYDCKVVGMIIKIYENSDEILIVPINRIIRFIRYIIDSDAGR